MRSERPPKTPEEVARRKAQIAELMSSFEVEEEPIRRKPTLAELRLRAYFGPS